MKRSVVNKKAVGLFPMFAEAFAVITGEHDKSVAVKVLSLRKAMRRPTWASANAISPS